MLPAPIIEATKKCSGCMEIKPRIGFYARPSREGGLRSRCIDCTLAEMKKRNATPEHKREVRRQALKREYNITPKEYETKFIQQGGRCAICRRHRSEQRRDLSVDHNHITGAVRGLLCARCNTGLGGANDDIQILESMISYLHRHAHCP